MFYMIFRSARLPAMRSFRPINTGSGTIYLCWSHRFEDRPFSMISVLSMMRTSSRSTVLCGCMAERKHMRSAIWSPSQARSSPIWPFGRETLPRTPSFRSLKERNRTPSIITRSQQSLMQAAPIRSIYTTASGTMHFTVLGKAGSGVWPRIPTMLSGDPAMDEGDDPETFIGVGTTAAARRGHGYCEQEDACGRYKYD